MSTGNSNDKLEELGRDGLVKMLNGCFAAAVPQSMAYCSSISTWRKRADNFIVPMLTGCNPFDFSSHSRDRALDFLVSCS